MSIRSRMFTYIWLIMTIILIKYTAGVQFNILNRERRDIWIGILANTGQPNLNNGGFILPFEQTMLVNVPDNWSGRLWARTWCNPNTQHCDTGDCGNRIECNGNGGIPPATLIQVGLNGNLTYYDISLVDGFNVKAAIAPVGNSRCKVVTCDGNINSHCPVELQVKNDKGIIACKSDCIAYNTDRACCRGDYGTPDTCPRPQSAQYFKKLCPNAYSYAFDNMSDLFTCQTDVYHIAFGG